MKIIDISWPITPDMTTYKNTQEVMVQATHIFERDHIRKSSLIMGTHTGTHIDAPSHVLQQGKTVDQISMHRLIGTAAVLNLTDVEEVITRIDLEQFVLPKGIIILLKTHNSYVPETGPFKHKFTYVDADAAAYCVEQEVRALGIDYLGLERNQPQHPAHTILAKHSIPVIEGLRLAHVDEGFYFCICLPLALIGLDAAPARAILIEDLV